MGVDGRRGFPALALLVGLIGCNSSSEEEGLPAGPAPITTPTPLPAAVNDAYSTNEDVTLNVAAPGVLTNDLNGASSAALIASPVYGVITLNSDGSFAYTPFGNYDGPDFFTYRVVGGAMGLYATVSLTVASVPDPPTAAPDFYSGNGSVGIAIPAVSGVLQNDGLAEITTGTLTAQLVTGPAHSSLFTLNTNGSFSYGAAAGWSGDDTFTYRCIDGPYPSAPCLVTLTTTSPNTPPIAANDALSTGEDVPITFNVMDNDSDPESFSLTASLVAGVAHGTLVLNADGTGSYVPVADWSGVDTFTYRAKDNFLYSTVATATITVGAFNGAIGPAYGIDNVDSPSTARLVRYPANGAAPLPIWRARAGWVATGFSIEPAGTKAWMLLTDFSGTYELRWVDLATQATAKVSNPAVGFSAYGLDFDSTGTIYTAGLTRLYRIDPGTGVATAIGPVLPAQMGDLAVGKGDQVYLVPFTLPAGSTWVHRYDPVADKLTAFSTMPAGADFDGSGMAVGAGIAADSNGGVYVSTMETNQVFRCKDGNANGDALDAGETTAWITLGFDPTGGGAYVFGIAVARNAGADVVLVNAVDVVGVPQAALGIWSITMGGVANQLNASWLNGSDGGCLAGPR